MSRLRLCAALVVLAAAPALAQQPPGPPLPRLDSISPPGGKAGTTVAEVALTGTDLDEADALLFSHPGIKAEAIVPPTPKPDPKDPKKVPPPPPKGPHPPHKFKVTVAPDVSPGNYDVRAVNKFGLSNPRVFVVGDLPEVMEKEPNNDAPEAMRLELNTTVNGTISAPTDVDLFLITAKKGQRIVLACLAESIDSRAQPLVEVYDQTARRLAGQNGPDAVTDFVAPADGDYFVRVAQFTYTAGGPQYFYRLTVTTGPWIDAVFPPMVEPGKATQVTLYGRNLAGGSPELGAFADGRPLEKLVVTVNPPADPTRLSFRGRIEPRSGGADGFEYRLKGPTGTSNPVLIGFAQDKVVLEKEPNDKPEQAMDVPAPCEVAGRIDRRGDRDWYAFAAKKGETFVIDLWGDRLGVPTDFLFTVRAAKSPTTDMVEKDDNPEILSNTQFYSRTTDPDAYTFTAPEGGKYLVQVTSREASYQYGPRVTYRLRIGTPRPDFRLVAMPASPHNPEATVLHADGSDYLKVYAFRSDGFTGPITLSVEGPPPGVTCPPQVIGPAQRGAALVLSAASSATRFDGPIVLKGTASVAGKPVVREARAATIEWAVQPMSNVPTITRLDNALMLSIRDKAHFKVTAEPENAYLAKAGEKLPQPLTMKQGEKLTVPFKVARMSPEAKVAINLRQVSTSQNSQQLPVTVNSGQPLPAVAPDKGDGTFVIEAKPNAPPGAYTIVLNATALIPHEREGKGKKPATVEQAVTPVTVHVVPSALAKVTASPAGNLKGGMTSDLVVKLERQNDYAGEYKVKLVLPANTKGVIADEIKIPAGQNEGKVVLKAAADAPAGQLSGLLVQVTGMYDGKVAITTESPKFNLTVEKAPAPKKEEPKKEPPKKEEAKKKEEPKKK
ncbi:MAG: PPC domain-containing protein [Zavarzinella sp.]|nr:PPC domain-containing protein [Zavarzinella sp.]